MLPYGIVLTATFGLLVLAKSLVVDERRRIALFCVVVLTLFALLRGYVGTDTYAYHLMFSDNIDQDLRGLLDIVEPIFAALLRVTALFSDDSFTFVVAIALMQGALLARLTATSRNPADFLLLYLAVFYLGFQFNVLRAGTAILFLLLANRVPENSAERHMFYVYGVLAVLSHYSAIVAFVPMLLLRIRLSDAKTFFATGLVIAAALFYFLAVSGEVIAQKYLLYSDLLTPDVTNAESLSFLLGLPLYLLLYASVVSRSNVLRLTSLLLIWVCLRWLTSMYSLVGRVEMIANALLLFSIIEIPIKGWRRQVRSASVVALSAMWITGRMLGLAAEDSILSNLGVEDQVYLTSPFVPYRFSWTAQ